MKKISLISVFLCFAGMLYLIASVKLYKNENNIIVSDAIHYYSYLPALLVYNDLSQKFLDTDIGDNKKYYAEQTVLPNGTHYFKTTMGVALLQSVIIVPLHFAVKGFGGDANGVSPIYKLGIQISALLYYVLALLLIRYLLSKKYKFDEIIIAFTILAIGMATNLSVYIFAESGMSHVYSFFCIALFLFAIDRFLASPSGKLALITGIIAGLLVLIRQVNLTVVILILLTWDIENFKDLKERVIFYITKAKYSLMFTLGAVLIWLPQFLYYYYITGNIFFSGYSNEARFFFDNPQILNNLFSYRKGWFLYTPMMAFAVIGFMPLFLRFRKSFWSILTILIVLIYINSSWYSWWFGGGYGLRAYIDIYALLAIPLAYFINMTWSKYRITAIATSLYILLFAFHNLFQSFQYINGSVHYSDMTKEAYWYSFGRLYPGIRLPALLESHNINLTKQGIYPKPSPKIRSKEEWHRYIVSRFKEDPHMMNFLTDKAKTLDRDIETVMYDDARWFLERDKALFCEYMITKKE